jgi:protein-tyrosine phosphatase
MVPMRILFVCMGNICRSPTAEATMRSLVHSAGLGDRIEVDSAGTGGWHAGEPPDSRAADAAARRGVELTGAARQVRATDFEEFDLLVAMDRDNLEGLLAIAPDAEAAAKVRLLGDDVEVPDPYYGGARGFDNVLDIVESGCRALLGELRTAGRYA